MFHFLAVSTLFIAVIIVDALADHHSVEECPGFPAKSAKFVEGNPTPINNIPYLVSIGTIDKVSNNYTHRCGGSIISKKWVLTAARCSPTTDDVIIAGISDLNKFDLSIRHEIRKVIIHAHYSAFDKGKTINDIALIRVKEPFEFSSNLNCVKLVKRDQKIVENSTATISGWGATNSSGQATYIKIPIVAKKKCNQIYHAKFSFNGHICGGFLQKMYVQWMPCRSDLGGPVVVNQTLAGIVSWGPVPCTRIGYPSVYTEIGYYREWIRRNMLGQ